MAPKHIFSSRPFYPKIVPFQIANRPKLDAGTGNTASNQQEADKSRSEGNYCELICSKLVRMWYLTSDNDDRVIYIIPQAEPVIIGRRVDNQVCNFAIPDDPSISRKHASLTVSDNILVFQDLGSRYGTFLNDSADKVELNVNIPLKENDIIKFGKMTSIWKVHAMNLFTCTSTLKGENLQKLKVTLSKIGGVLKNEWDDSCNYLTMPAITLTIKVVLALVQASHIVTTEFWTKFLESVNHFKTMPDPQNFMPAVVESTLNKEVVSFLPDARRKSIFRDKKFVFFSRRQYEMYKQVLIKSGASPLLLGECKMTVSMLCEENVIVIQFIANAATQETQAQRNQVNEIITQLKTKGKRVIADAEIGLAILYCSVEKYCNPNFSFTSEVVKQNSGVLPKTSRVLAPESQDSTLGIKDEKENLKINESYASEKQDLSVEKTVTKRKFDEFTNEANLHPNKKVATDWPANIPNESNKRRLSGDISVDNPSKKMALDNDSHDQGSSNSSEDILHDKDKSDDMFNFINPVSNNNTNENKTKKLNLTRPQKRKLDATNEDGDLFNFVQTENDKDNEGETSKQSIFSSHKVKKGDNTTNAFNVKKTASVTPEQISAMRGIKLKELMESNLTTTETTQEHIVKIEKCEDLEDKMSNLDLGNTVVIISTTLVVKKEPFKTEPENDTISLKNFKTFKKVWPVRKQKITIPPSSMSLGNLTDTNTYSEAF